MKRIVALYGALFCCVLLLGACGGGSTAALPVNSTLMPAHVPSGWRVFHGAHFALAYPEGWTANESMQASTSTSRRDINYGFASADHKQLVSVTEQDGWDSGSVQKVFCQQQGAQQGTSVQMAGLTWRYMTAQSGAMRVWILITGQGTVYGLGAMDGTQPQAVQQQNEAVLATFHAEYTAPGCK